jgi:hypothetical protein
MCTLHFVMVYILWRYRLWVVKFMFWKLYVLELLHCVQLRFVTLGHVTFTLCSFTLCSNILIQGGGEVGVVLNSGKKPLNKFPGKCLGDKDEGWMHWSLPYSMDGEHSSKDWENIYCCIRTMCAEIGSTNLRIKGTVSRDWDGIFPELSKKPKGCFLICVFYQKL